MPPLLSPDPLAMDPEDEDLEAAKIEVNILAVVALLHGNCLSAFPFRLSAKPQSWLGTPTSLITKHNMFFWGRYMCLMKENPCCGEKIWWQLCFTEKNVYRYCKFHKKMTFFRLCRPTTNIYQIDSDLVCSLIL